MSGETRRKQIVQLLSQSEKPIPGVALAEKFQVSRQVIVQDIALIRANGVDIFSTNRGYLVHQQTQQVSRVFKVMHED